MNSLPVQRAHILLKDLNRPILAEAELRRALSNDPQDPMAHVLLALSLGDQGRMAEAEAEIAKAIELVPDHGDAHRVRGWLAWRLEDYQAAEDAFRECLRIFPRDQLALQCLSAMLCNLRRPREALAFADRALEISAEDAICLNRRAVALINLGRLDEAQVAVNAALRSNPLLALNHYSQAWIHRRRENRPLARQSFLQALRLSPTDEDSQRELRGMLFFDAGFVFFWFALAGLAFAILGIRHFTLYDEWHPSLRFNFGFAMIVGIPAAIGLFRRPLKVAALGFTRWAQHVGTPADFRFARWIALGCVAYGIAGFLIWRYWADVPGALDVAIAVTTLAFSVLASAPSLSRDQQLKRVVMRIGIVGLAGIIALRGVSKGHPEWLSAFLVGIVFAMIADLGQDAQK